MGKRILLLVNWKNRDLRGLVHLKILLEKKFGHKVKLVNHRDSIYKIITFCPHIVIFPQIAAEKDKSLIAKRQGALVGVINSEGAVSEIGIQSVFSLYTEEVVRLTDFQIVWGGKFRNLLLDHTTMQEQKIHVCGSPRFDIYRNPLKKILDNSVDMKKELSLPRDTKIVLFCTNFILMDRDKDALEVSKTQSKGNIDRAIEIQRILFKKIMSCIYKIVNERKDITLIIKAHPLELIDKYNEFRTLENFSRIVILKDFDISFLVNICDIFLHYNSTTVTEAWFCNKPTITLNFEKEYEKYLTYTKDGTDIVNNCRELDNMISYYLSCDKINKNILKNREKYINDWYYQVDGKSTERAAEVIDSYAKLCNKRIKKFNGMILQDVKEVFRYIVKSKLRPFKTITKKIFFKKEKLGYYERIAETELTTKRDIKRVESTLRAYLH